MRKRVACLAVLLAVLWACALPASAADAPAKRRKVTVMVYMVGSDLESAYGKATRDMVEMLRSGYDRDDVNVVVLTGGASKWHSGFPSDRSGLYLMDGTSRPTEIMTMEPLNMGDPASLTFLLDRAVELFPADSYALIFWDHGAGPLNGVGIDLRFDKDTLTVPELRSALEAGPFGEGNRLAFIGFDACLMADAEVALACAPYARYMIASQELEPGNGWDYAFLRGIEDDADPSVTARRVIDLYWESYSTKAEAGVPITMACLDLDRVADLHDSTGVLFGGLDAALDTSFADISRGREQATDIGRASGVNVDLVDLWEAAENAAPYAPKAARNTQEALEATVVYSRSNVPGLHGLSVYWPFFNRERFERPWQEEYRAIGFSEGYIRYVLRFGSVLLTDPLANYAGLMPAVSAGEDGVREYTLQLTGDQAAAFSSGQMHFMLHSTFADGWEDVTNVPDVTLDENNVLHARWDGQTVCLVNEEGDYSFARYARVGEYYNLFAYLLRADFDQGIVDGLTIMLQCLPNAEGTGLDIVRISRIDGDLDVAWDISDMDLTGYSFGFVFGARTPLRGENGVLLPTAQWGSTGAVSYSAVPADSDWKLEFRPMESTQSRLGVAFQITDVQGNTWCSEILEVDNDLVTPLFTGGETVRDGDVEMTLTGVSLWSDGDPANDTLLIDYRAANRGGEKLSVMQDNLYLDGRAVRFIQNASTTLEPGEAFEGRVRVRVSSLLWDGVDHVDGRLGFNVSVTDKDLTGKRDALFFWDTGGFRVSADTAPEPPAPLGEATADGVTAEVLSIAEEEDSLRVTFRLINRTGSGWRAAGFSQYGWIGLNGTTVYRYADPEDARDLYLPDGVEAVCRYVIPFDQTGSFASASQPSDLLREMGITEIRSVQLEVGDQPSYDKQIPRARVSIPLEEPFILSTAGQEDLPVLCEADGLIFRLRDVRITSGDYASVSVNVRIDNTTDGELTPGDWRYGSIDGEQAFWSTTPLEAIPPHASLLAGIESFLKRDEQPHTLVVPMFAAGTPGHSVTITLPDADLSGGSARVQPVSFESKASGEEAVVLLIPEVTVADGALDHGRTFAAPLTPEQSDRADTGLAGIISIDDRGDWCLNGTLRVRRENGAVVTDLPGWVAVVSGEREVIWPCTPTDDPDVWELYAPLVNYTNYEKPVLRIDRAAGTAVLDPDPLESTELASYADVFEILLVGSYYRFERQADGTWPSLLDFSHSDMLMRSLPLTGGPLTMTLRPIVPEDGLYLVFSVEYEDGGGMSTEPIPLGE